jgi:hypothetical protein
MTYDTNVSVYAFVMLKYFFCMILVLILLCLSVFVGMSFGAFPEALSEEACEGLRSCAAACCQMETPRGHSDLVNYRGLIDLMVNGDVN